eukprot:5561231-Ditylum_brightwellii.AAC.1
MICGCVTFFHPLGVGVNSGGVLGGGRFSSGGITCGAEGWTRFFLCDRSTLVFGGGLSLET